MVRKYRVTASTHDAGRDRQTEPAALMRMGSGMRRLGSAFAIVAPLIACGGTDRPPLSGQVDFACIDVDRDGYGLGCGTASDCDDRDPSVHTDCAPCRVPGPGCACESEGALSPCGDPSTLDGDGQLECKRGTMACVDGVYSACRIDSIQRISSAQLARYRALIDRDATPVSCDPCDPDCFRVEDPLDVVPDGGVDLSSGDGGGLTIAFAGDASLQVVEPPPLDTVPCTLGQEPDPDCDGIPTMYDALPGVPPFPSNHATIFMGLPPGSAGSQTLGVDFRLNSADVYFYLDMSTDGYDPDVLPDPSSVLPDADGFVKNGDLDPVRPMGALKNAISAALTSGNYLPDGSIVCGDVNGDGAPDNGLKAQGILGNLACLIPDVAFGAGWFRDIPFVGPYATGQYVAAERTFMFGHASDVTSDPKVVSDAISHFTTTENVVSPTDSYYGNIPEGSMQGLWALATGGEVYAGWSRAGIPARTTCPNGTWGYPCFRNSAMPIVMHVTDAPMQNGPRDPGAGPYTGRGCLDDFSTATCNPIDYDGDVIDPATRTSALAATPDGTYHPLSVSAESFATAQPVGTLNGALVTYVGDSTAMSSDVIYAGPTVGCSFGAAWAGSDQNTPDAVFAFTVENPVDLPFLRPRLLVSARGTEYDVTLMILRADAAFQPTGPFACADDNGGYYVPDIQREFPNGNYVAVVKGYASSEWGRFQVTFGDPDLATPTAFAAHTWDGAGGIAESLLERNMRVIGVCATPSGDCAADNPYTAEQSSLLAKSTAAFAADGSPLSFSVDPYDSADHVGRVIVGAVSALANERTMDVTLRLRQDPDDPNPDFLLTVEAIDTPGDACDPPVDTNADGRPDMHPACRPGARPRFRVTFSNPPVPRQVRPNPKPGRPGGGYLMRLQLMGDTSFILDEIPVYLVPEAVGAPPSPNPYRSEAVYEQTVYSTGCIDNESPLWQRLGWDATVPSGTELLWELCLGETEADLDTCTYVQIASVQSGGQCTIDSQCENGYCDASGACHFVTGPSCTAATDCGTAGQCVSDGAGSHCMWTANPVSIPPALLPSTQGLPFARVRMTLRANGARSLAPVVNRYRVEYVCAPLR